MINSWLWALVSDPFISVESLSLCRRLYLGFSGGLDSTVLLHALANSSLCHKIIAVHINHGLNSKANAWALHCEMTCRLLGVPLIVENVTISLASNIEEQARHARYEVFRGLLQEHDGLVLAHHRDDQAETVLLQLFRGAGVEGLAAMAFVKSWAKGQLFRPLLEHSRQSLLHYATEHQLQWIEDDSNTDTRFSRNFLRQEVIPLLQTRWPGVINTLTRTAKHCALATQQLSQLASHDYPELEHAGNRLSLATLQSISPERLSNVLRAWIKRNHVLLPDTATFNRIMSEIIPARLDASPKIVWGAHCIKRYQQTLWLLPRDEDDKDVYQTIDWHCFPDPLMIHSGVVRAEPSLTGLYFPPNSHIQIRFRQGGEYLIWRKQSKSLKKLFQQWQIPTWMRHRIPLLFIDNELAAVIGYAVSDVFYQANSSQRLWVINWTNTQAN